MANTNRRKNKDDKFPKGKRNKTMKLEEADELKFMSPDERIQYVIENVLIKDEPFDVALRKENLNEDLPVPKPNKLPSKGLLKKRNKHLDSISKSELLTGQPTTRENTKPGDDNKRKPNITKAAKESIKTNNIQDNDELIEITIDINNPIVPAEQTNPNETKKQTQKSKSNSKNSDMLEITVDMNIPAEAEQTDSTTEAKSNKNTHYQCDHCQAKFGVKSSLQRHMLMHLDLKPFTCSHCPNRKFRQRVNWRIHMARIHPEAFKKMKFECNICKKPFVSLEHLKLHQKVHMNKKKHHTCKFCKKAFKQQWQLARHEKCHMFPDRYKCTMCPASYDNRLLYSEHLKSHSQVEDYTCQFCDKSFLSLKSIVKHIQVNHTGLRVQCPVCNKLLKGHLHEHMRTHENLRPHECEECGQRFTQSTQLTIHKRSHTGVRPYPCRICKQPFSHSNALMLHIRRHTGEKPFECAMCSQTFSQLPHMKAHMRNIHKKMEFYKCNNCNTFFKLKTLLEAHAEECGDGGSVKKKDKGDDTLVSRMRFLLALWFTMSASKQKLMDLGFNKRLIDDILVEWIEEEGLTPCKDAALAALPRLQNNALTLLRATVPKHQTALFVKQNKSAEEILELLTVDHRDGGTYVYLKTLLEAHAEECGDGGSVKKKDKGDDTLVSRMRFLLALWFTMSASKQKLMDLGILYAPMNVNKLPPVRKNKNLPREELAYKTANDS